MSSKQDRALIARCLLELQDAIRLGNVTTIIAPKDERELQQWIDTPLAGRKGE